jgi:SPP1 gp7 family putative phage head morphogenesis protein
MPTKTPIEQGIIARLTGAWNVVTGKSAVIDNGNEWFGPLNPPTPIVTGAQAENIVGRQFDFAPGYNIKQQPRSGETVTFGQMRALADNSDILRLVIETRKDQVAKMKFVIKPTKEHMERDKRCEEVEAFLRLPDGENNWSDWLRQLLEEMMVTDSATIYPWLTNGGTPYRFELMDGATIKRVIDARGRTPMAPAPAYQQVLKGVIAANYTIDELIYAPRNKRVHKVYGYSPVEQIIMTVNIAIRRSLHQLQYYTDGSTPDLLFQVPAEWNITQLKEFNDYWQDTLSGNTAARRKAQFVPGGVTPVNTKEAILKDPYDEWLARIICYAFSVSAQPFIKENNRSTAETAANSAIEEGLLPVMLWIKGLMDKIVWKYFGYTDLEFAWEDQSATNPADQNKIDDINVKNGTATINEIRAKRGEPSIGAVGDLPLVLTANGYVPITGLPPVTAQPNVGAGDNNSDPSNGDGKEPPEDPSPTPPPTKKISKADSVPRIDRESADRVSIRDHITTELTAIFKKQADALVNVVTKVAKDASIDPDDPFKDSSWQGWQEIQDLFGTQLVLAGSLGVSSAFAQINMDDAGMFTLANDEAIAHAKARAAELVGKQITSTGTIIDNPNPAYSIPDATREMIRGDIVEALTLGSSNEELAAKLEANYAFSAARAETIARTETALADCEGNVVVYRKSKVVSSKQWITGLGCCAECAAVNGETVALDKNFKNGVSVPPAHPNCRCDFIPILNEE